VSDDSVLELHIEPARPIEVTDLTAAMGSLARQYQLFAVRNNLAAKTADARLLVSSVSPGSIDIDFIPEVWALGATVLPFLDRGEIVLRFAEHIKRLIELFKWGSPKQDDAGLTVSVRDCEDVVNITKPIAKNGGTQVFNTINGGVTMNVLQITGAEAQRYVENAARAKAELQFPNADTAQRVPLIWKRLDRDSAKTGGESSPDKAIIEEIDTKARAVFFTDEMSFLKEEMIGDEQNPYQYVYFVDVHVSRVQSRVVSYRVVGYHGKEPLPTDDDHANEETL